MTNMFNSVALSTENYDSLLIGWNNLSLLQNDTVFSGGDSYYCLGGDARQGLNDSWDWTVTEGGYNCTLPNITDVIVINESGVVDGTIIRGDNVTINVTLEDEYGIDKVWIKVWEGVVGASSVLYEGFLTLVGAFWTVTFGTNSSFNLGEVNYTIYVNNSEGEEVNESGNFTIENFAPVINSSRIYSVSNTTTHDLLGYCNGSDPEGENFTYYYKWYKNDVVNTTGDVINDSDSEVNVDNISSSLLGIGDNWTLSCLVGDGSENSSWLNSSEVHIHQGCAVFNEPGVYALTKNLSSSGTCFEINVSNVTLDCQDYAIAGNSTGSAVWMHGVYGNNLFNVTVSNCLMENFSYGLRVDYTNDSLGEFIDVSSMDYPIYLYAGGDNRIVNVSLNASSYGIQIGSSRSNNITNMTCYGASATYGVYLNGADLNRFNGIIMIDSSRGLFIFGYAGQIIFENVIISDATVYGIKVDDTGSTQNIFRNGTILRAEWGIAIDYLANENEFYNINISDSTGYGVYFEHPSSGDNIFYNNYFENDFNFRMVSGSDHYWNTSNTTGPNIVGGANIGGNYWTVPGGLGYSDVCDDDDSDGFCDNPYVMEQGETDYLPLAGTGDTNLSSCTIIATPGLFNLTDDIDNASDTCMIIRSSDVVFDCLGHYIDGEDTGDGIFVDGEYESEWSNITIGNCEIREFSRGMYVEYAQDSRFENITIYDNPSQGLSTSSTVNVNYTNITASGGSYPGYFTADSNIIVRESEFYNGGGAAVVITSDDSEFRDSTFKSCSGTCLTGNIYLNSADGNLFYNITVSNSTDRNFYWFASDNNNMTKSYISDGADGIYMRGGSVGNNFYENNFSDHSSYSIEFRNEGSNDNNKFYNNYFWNTGNNFVYAPIAGNDNDWNVSKQSGTNIMDGIYIAGNFWDNSTGGYSTLCTDSEGDGLCDDSYLLDNDQTDYLPLTYYTNSPPNNVTVSLLSTDGLNLTTSDLNCSGVISDEDGDDLNVSVRWYKNSILNLSFSYNDSYTNGTEFSAILDSGNTTKNEVWNCSIRVYDSQVYSGWGNSSELEVLNSLPTVILVAPTDWNDSTNRSLEFNWNGSDDDGDSLTFEITIGEYKFEGSDVCSDDRLNSSLNEESYVPSSDLYCLHDNGFYYNWSVRAHDGVGWGVSSDVWHFNVTAEIDINLDIDEVNFGSLSPGNINDSSDDNPSPFVIDNNGNVVTNISLNSSAIWNTESGDSSYYQFKVDNVTGEEGAFDWLLSIVSWFDVPITGEVVAVGELNYADGDDSAEVDIRLEVPGDESPGAKNGWIVFKGVLAE